MSLQWEKAGKNHWTLSALVAMALVFPVAGAAQDNGFSSAAGNAEEPAVTERQLRFELNQLKLMNERQQKLIDQLEGRLQRLAAEREGNGTASTVTGDNRQVGVDKREQAVKAREASRSLEDFLQEEHAVFTRRFTLEPSFTYSASDRKQLALSGFLALDAIFLGRLNVDEVDNRIFTFDLTGRYSLTDRLQFFARVPWVYRETEYSTIGLDFSTGESSAFEVNKDGLGDVEFGAQYRLKREGIYWPDLVLSVRGKAPTGTDPYGIKNFQPDPDNTNLRIPEELATGSGLWSGTVGLSFVKTADPAIWFGSTEYTRQFPEDFSDISSSPNAFQPGEVKLGDSWQFSLGTAFALNDNMSMSFSFNNRIVQDSEFKTAATAGWDTIDGSSANVATFNIGTTLGITRRFSVALNLAMGLSEDASDYSFSVRLPYRF